MEGSPFYEFPKTPHMAGSTVVDDDEVVSDAQITNYIKAANITAVVIQEKVDGSNVSVYFNSEWEPVIQKRSGLVGQGERPQYNVWRDYVYSKMEEFWGILDTKYCLFGEWLWCQHGIAYDALPDFLSVFDIMERETGKFLDHQTVIQMIGNKFNVVPLLKVWQGPELQNIALSAEITKLLNTKSKYGKETQEGVYVRFENGTQVAHRVKMRRKTFVAGRADFDKNIINNKLKS